ncbi:hypothetical protein, conserved in T. vivax [Trypanosoma vivax Y486]|uniref:Uncharacterized protein n=1 Tax=Trypanosoma vivax (strain Y486) TaxID=1055687 RepID=F9WMQ4_TRYVY|nr:hypothetical protein, conserved in T. vivax [Trypanosoma vivax Y486]|eukprot:CCD18815.1 hypothetical protein, conserved in T. vivax [Trypanosoma vivax Y486]
MLASHLRKTRWAVVPLSTTAKALRLTRHNCLLFLRLRARLAILVFDPSRAFHHAATDPSCIPRRAPVVCERRRQVQTRSFPRSEASKSSSSTTVRDHTTFAFRASYNKQPGFCGIGNASRHAVNKLSGEVAIIIVECSLEHAHLLFHFGPRLTELARGHLDSAKSNIFHGCRVLSSPPAAVPRFIRNCPRSLLW